MSLILPIVFTLFKTDLHFFELDELPFPFGLLLDFFVVGGRSLQVKLVNKSIKVSL